MFLPQHNVLSCVCVFPFSQPSEMPVMPKIALRSPSDRFLMFQDASPEFKTVSAVAQQLGPEVQVRL